MNKTKLVVAVSLFLFFITVTASIAAGLVIMELRKSSGFSGTKILGQGGASVADQSAVLSVFDVAGHNSESDCWIVISQKVYNISSYFSRHPGGAAALRPYCGSDATAAFSTKDKQPPSNHSDIAHQMLAEFFVADLGTPLSQITATPTPAPGLNSIVPSVIPTAKPAPVTSTRLSLTSAEIARHASLSDCWLIISGRVYDVSRYINDHPGGAGAIAPFCGQDGTAAFANKGRSGGSGHSSFASGLLNNYLIGSVGSAVTLATPAPVVPTQPVVLQPTTVPANANQSLTLTSAEVASHNTLQNCWLIISGKVYEVTSYVFNHPGGANAISPYCGKDGTQAFSTKGGKGSNHSSGAYSQLNGYLIGSVNSTVSAAPTGIPGTTTNPPSSNLPSGVAAKYPGATIIKDDVEDDGRHEMKINYNGSCRKIKTNSSGAITEDERC